MATWKNNRKTKLMILSGTRPEIVHLAEWMKRAHEYFDTMRSLIPTGRIP